MLLLLLLPPLPLQAHAMVRVARPIINPNSGFVGQLKQFEVHLKLGTHKASLELDGSACQFLQCMPPWDFECWQKSRKRAHTQDVG